MEPGACGGGRAAEGVAVEAGGDAECGVEVLAQRCGGAETGLGGDPVDGEVGVFQQLPGVFDALLGEPLRRGDAGLVAEATGEGPDAH